MTETSSQIPLALYSRTTGGTRHHTTAEATAGQPKFEAHPVQADPYHPHSLNEVCLNGTGQLFDHDQLSFDI